MLSSCAAFLTLTLLSGPPAATPPGPFVWVPEVHRVELPVDGAGAMPSVRVTPGFTTTLLFDAPIVTEGVRLEGCERCRVSPAKDAVTLVPVEELRPGQALKLTVPFADGAAPASMDIPLVVHPVAERQVEVFRQRRTVESLKAEVKEKEAAVQRCQQDLTQLRAEHHGPGGLMGALTSDFMTETGIPARVIAREALLRPGTVLRLTSAVTYRARVRVAVDLRLWNPASSPPWTAVGARLAGKEGELRVLTVWQPHPVAPGSQGRLVLEADATEKQARGPLTLTLWTEDGQRPLVIGNVLFP
jgi:uncharacterized protein (TIGR02268 family)